MKKKPTSKVRKVKKKVSEYVLYETWAKKFRKQWTKIFDKADKELMEMFNPK